MATKGNLINTARELVGESAEILARATRARKSADAMFDELKRMDAAIARRRRAGILQRVKPISGPAAATTPCPQFGQVFCAGISGAKNR